MKCRECGKFIDNDFLRCPFCGAEILNITNKRNTDEDIEVSLDKTIAISTIKELDLIDEINKQIEAINDDSYPIVNVLIEETKEEKDLNVEELVNIDINDENVITEDDLPKIKEESDDTSLQDEDVVESVDIRKSVEEQNEDDSEEKNESIIIQQTEERFDTDESLKKRKNVLTVCFLIVAVLCLIGGGIFFAKVLDDKEEAVLDYQQRMDKALKDYYETKNIDEIIYILEDVKNDSEKVKKLQEKARLYCDSWILLYIEENTLDRNEFEKVTTRYQEIFDGLYRYAIVTTDDRNIRLLTEKDYEDIKTQFNDVYNDSAEFFIALAAYEEKDYNNAYYLFGKIDEDNSYYDKSVAYNKQIISNIIELLEKDIKMLEVGIDELGVDDKLDRYILIEDTILEYNNIYSVNLSSFEEYQLILSEYTSKVFEYTEMIQNAVDA